MPNATTRYANIAGSASEYFHRYAGPPLSEPQNRQLGALVRAGNASAREKMICGNIKLIPIFAEPFLRCWEPDEVISNGILGLMNAVDLYDPTKGVFSSYARLKIRQHILVALANQRPLVRVPRNVAQKLVRWRRMHVATDDAMPADLAKVALLEETRSLDERMDDDDYTLADTLAAPDTDFPIGEREEIEERLGPANAFVEVLDAVSARPPSVARLVANNSRGGLNHNHNQERNTTMTNETTKTIRASSGCEEKQARTSRSRNSGARFENSTMPQPQSKPGQQLEFEFHSLNANNERNYAN